MNKKQQTSESSSTAQDQDEPKQGEALPGWPGYRTRDARSGYDPVDSRTEAAHTTGTAIRQLFTGQLLVRKLVSIVLLGVFGVILLAPLVLAVSEWANGAPFSPEAAILFLIAGVTGVFLLVNVIKSLAKRA